MKKFKIFVILFSLIAGVSLIANPEIIKFPVLVNPGSIIIDKGFIYINDGPSIFIYSLKDFSLKKKFGREGEGPEEFKVNPNINKGGVYLSLNKDNLFITSIRRVSFFSKMGKFKRIINPKSHIGKLLSVGDSFVSHSVAQDGGAEFITINLYDQELIKKKELFRRLSWDAEREMDLIRFTRFPLLYVNNDRIFTGGKVYDDVINVFDHQGKKVSAITHDYEKVKISGEHKKLIMDYFEKSPGYRGFLNSVRSRIKFAKFFPSIRHFQVADQKVFVATYRMIKGQREFYIFSTGGKFLKKTLLPLMEDDLMHLKPYTIHKNKFYQLQESEDGEEWELHITEVK